MIQHPLPSDATRPCHGRRTATLAVLALVLVSCGAQGPVGRTEAAMQLYIDGLEAHARGDIRIGRSQLEQACKLGHEPSCQEVWLRVDMEIDSSRIAVRNALKYTAQRVAAETDGVYFLYEEASAVTARVYCPVTQHEELASILSAFDQESGS